MPVKTEIGPTEFEELLKWLDPDPDAAGYEYERIRQRLIKIFHARGCTNADELADETIDRVTRRIGSLRETYEGEPTAYFLGVARNVFLEHLRKPKLTELPAVLPAIDDDHQTENAQFECLNRCLGKLPVRQYELIIGYYEGAKRSKIDNRKYLVELLGTTSEALRVRVLRLRLSLQKCVLTCLENNFSETF